jgi:hypothetical protein
MTFEQDHTPTAIEEYVSLRVLSREVLASVGIMSNIGFTDHNILQSLSSHLGAEDVELYDQHHERAEELFRRKLAALLGIEVPAQFGQLENALTNLIPKQ